MSLHKPLLRVIQLLEQLRDAHAGVPLTPIGLSGEVDPRKLHAFPHDYLTLAGTAPLRCRVVRVVVPSTEAAVFEIRHVLFGKGRLAQFHGAAIPALAFAENGPGLAVDFKTVLEAGDPIEVNVVPTSGDDGVFTARVVLFGLALGEEAEASPGRGRGQGFRARRAEAAAKEPS